MQGGGIEVDVDRVGLDEDLHTSLIRDCPPIPFASVIPLASRLPFRIFIEHTGPTGPPRQKSRVKCLKAKVKPLLTYVTVEYSPHQLSSERGTCKTVKARFWPWLSGERH